MLGFVGAGLGMIAALLAAGAVWQVTHLALVVTWSDAQTRGARYYARSRDERRAFKRLLRGHALLLSPILWLLGLAGRRRFSQGSVRCAGVALPAGACSAQSFRRAAEYEPRSEDVFVVTQMRSGTTWMQHLVLQVLTRGHGDLPRDGAALGAVSPWLESIRTVDVLEAPLVGSERPARIIKTHLPATLCPFSRRAKYIYVARHPLACFASCADFVRKNLHGFAPDWAELVRWFQSDELMWWGDWVTHLDGWQGQAAREDNVLLVRYEDMANDLAAVATHVAGYLEISPLSPRELACVVQKCALEYMRAHEDAFEMHPPHLLQTAHPFFSDGRKHRSRSVPPESALQIMAWCRAQCAARGGSIGRLYPNLVEGAPAVADRGNGALFPANAQVLVAHAADTPQRLDYN